MTYFLNDNDDADDYDDSIKERTSTTITKSLIMNSQCKANFLSR